MEYITEPALIEERSMEIIAPYLADLSLTQAETRLYARMIHASGDPAYAPLIRLHPQAVSAGLQALRQGADICTDVEMVRTGINKTKLADFGGQVHCLIADGQVAQAAREQGITRAMAAMDALAEKLQGAVVAIGNAPTALFRVLELMQSRAVRPALLIGVPVGFVGAGESKEYLAAHSPVPYITVAGTKGGSSIAVAAVNALLYMI